MRKLALISFVFLTCAGATRAQDPGWPRQKNQSRGGKTGLLPTTGRRVEPGSWVEVPYGLRADAHRWPADRRDRQYPNPQRFSNLDNRTVLLADPVITGTSFPSLDAAKAAPLDQLVRTFLTTGCVDHHLAGPIDRDGGKNRSHRHPSRYVTNRR